MIISNPKDHAIVLKSFDGDSVHVPAKAMRVRVADKFGWHVPNHVRVHVDKNAKPELIDPTTIVPSRPIPEPSIRPPKSAEEAVRLRNEIGAMR